MKKNNIRETFQFLFESFGDQTSQVSQERMRDDVVEKSAKMMYRFGDFYPSENNPVGIVVIEEGHNGHPLTIMSLTSFDADGKVCYDEQRLTWDEAMKGAQKYNPDGKSEGKWELPSVEQFRAAFDIPEDNSSSDEAIRKINFLNERIDELNKKHGFN